MTIPAPPNLVTVTVDGKRIDAVAQVTKQGFTYVFDRVTGQPVWPIEERPVDTTTDVPGEQVWPTQPFPTKPPAFTPQGVLARGCQRPDAGNQGVGPEEMEKYRIGPLYTPNGLRGTLQRPSMGRRKLGRCRVGCTKPAFYRAGGHDPVCESRRQERRIETVS